MLATLIRMELAHPGVSIFMGDGIKYLMISTLHGIIMVFFMIIPLIFGAYGNYLLPLQLGVHDVAFPRMNSAAFWFLPAGLIMLCQLISLDKRYHTVNCFSFNRVDSYLNFEDVKTNYEPQIIFCKNKSHSSILNYNLFTNKTTSSNFSLLHKYNLFAKNYNINYNYYTPSWSNYKFINFYSINYFFKYIQNLRNTTSYSTNFNYVSILMLLNNINVLKYYKNNCFILKNYQLILFNNIGFYNIVIIAKNKINFTYNLNILKYKFINVFNHQKNNSSMYYNYFQLNLNHKNNTQIDYNTQFSFKKRNPLIVRNKVIDMMLTPDVFMKQLNQAYYDIYNKYYLRVEQVSGHMKCLNSNFNILLVSNYLKNLFLPLQYSEFINNNTLYLYRYNVKLHENILFSAFDKTTLHDPNIFIYNSMLGATTNLFMYNNLFINQHNLSLIFKKYIININNHHQIFSKWKHLRFQREFWRCRSMITKNTLNNYKYHTEWSFLFDLSNKYSVLSDSADVLPGWAFVTPFSARIRYTRPGKTDVALCAIAISSFGSFIGSLNFLITYRYLSTLNNKKMRDARCFFAEGLLVGSGMMVAANPVLFIAIFLLLSDRHWKTSFFDYSNGGDTVLFQHLFWFFGHPEVYIIIIPCFGLVNTILSYFLRKRLSARASLLYSMYTISFLSFFVWGHHMYMVGLSHHTRMLYSTITVMISVPAATKIMHWLVTIVNSSIHYELPLIFSIIFIFLFVSGGISGMAVAHTGMDILFHDTFYVIGHFHVMFAGAAMFATFGAFYFYFPFIWGVKYNRVFAYFHLIYYLIGQLMTVVPMLWLGYAGMPRRILDYPAVFGGWHSVISSGHLISTAGIASFFMMLFISLKQQKLATNTTLGIGRYNTRLNFYLYEYSKLLLIRRKYKIFIN